MTDVLRFQDFVPELALGGNGMVLSATDNATCTSMDVLVLFVDMSGFSRIAADLIAGSERGAEALGDLVNAVFEMVVTSINDHGGSLLYYAGDAVNAVWPVCDETIGLQGHRALACGLDIQRKCKDLPAMWQDFGIRIKATLHRGPLATVNAPCGPVARQILFCGEVLEGLADFPSNGVDAGVVLLPDVASAINAGLPHPLKGRNTGPVVIIAEVNAPETPVPAAQISAEDSSVYVHPHLRSAIESEAPNWLAEFREAHVLFLRLPSYRFSDGHDLERCAEILDVMGNEIDAQGGTLLQICTDDKGLVCIAAWGLAKSAYENDAARAVLAAQAMARHFEQMDLSAQVAITSGKIFAGLLGARPLVQYCVVGDVLARAASITVQQPAAIAFDHATMRNLPTEFVCSEIAQLALKGHNAPVPVFAVSRQQIKNVHHQGGIVGRKQERQALRDALSRWHQGESRDIRIFANAGLGKSRLAAWFQEQVQNDGLTCLRMNADQLRQSSSYLPLRQVFDQLFDWPKDTTVQQTLARLAALFDGDDALLPLLNPILPVELPLTEQSKSLIGSGRAELTRTIIVSLLQKLLTTATSRRTTALLVEDAHWLDSASWLCIEAAKREIDGLALVIVARPIDVDLIPTEAKKLIEKDDVALYLEIGMLSRDDTAAIVQQSLQATEVADQISDLIFREAAGHPLYTIGLAGSLVDRGLIRLDRGYAHLHLGDAPLSSIVFPQGVKGVISERISVLGLEHQLAIKAAAVLGRHFDLATLAAIHPVATQTKGLEPLMADLTTSGLIDSLGADKFRFHHAIIADCAHEMLTTAQQHSLHTAAGQNIEADVAASGDNAGLTQLALLGYHFERAKTPEKAIPYLARAAAAARRGYGNVEVVDFLSRALALGKSHVSTLERGEWQVQIAESLRALGQYQRAEAFLKTAIAALAKPAPETGLKAAGRLLGEFAKFKLHPHKPEQPDNIRKPIITAADANMMLSEIHYELNKIPFALSEILTGANLARKAGGDSATLSKLYIGMALISTSLPWALDGDDLQKRALEIADRLDDPATTAWVYMVSGVYETGKGGWQRGADHLNRSRALSESCGERKTWETAMSCLGNHKRLEGHFEAAKGWSDLTMQASRERGIDHGIIWSHNGRARDLLCQSQFEELRGDVAALERLLNDPTKTGDSNDNNNLVFHYAKAFCALKDGHDDQARAEFNKVIDMLKNIKRPQVYMIQNVDYYCDIIWNLWHRGHRDTGLMQQQKLVAKSGRQIAKQYHAGAPMALLAKGDAAWFQGDTKAASTAWRASVDAANTREMPYNAAHALFRMEQTGAGDQSWENPLAKLGIKRPALWAFDV